jgi:hypothetical protein
MNEKVSRILSELKNRLQAIYGNPWASVVLFGSQAERGCLIRFGYRHSPRVPGGRGSHAKKEKVMTLTAELSLENESL